MKYFITILLFIFISCGDEIENNIPVSNKNICYSDIDCSDPDLSQCKTVLNRETDKEIKECSPKNCFGTAGYIGNGEDVWSYYKAEDKCIKFIKIKAEDN